MGWFSKDKKPYKDIPDEKLDFNQQQEKKWSSNMPFYVASGGYYTPEARAGLANRLMHSFGTHKLDDVIEMRAPRFYHSFHATGTNIENLCKYVYENLEDNINLQQLQGKYDELQKRCEDQKVMIEKLMAQNEKLQNQLLERSNEHTSSFSR